ncbi:hypothetical protein FG379_000053 [Cryptosporidium bovis]|uniref:uncharacterized protein n=1 Tax=Cryptosporidium bovis TaxID=310047 RepID=UPI00351A5EBE|nr:hypothetical protein FG379_000053 [Cryptosporidium bovis]
MHDSAIRYIEEIELYSGNENSEARERNNHLISSLDESITNERGSSLDTTETGLHDESILEETVRGRVNEERNEFIFMNSEAELTESGENLERNIPFSSVDNIINRIRDGIRAIMLSGREQLPVIKFTLRLFIILSLTLIPLINELNSVIPLVSMFMNDNNWILIPRLTNKQIIDKDLLLRLNSYESALLTNSGENFKYSYSFNHLNLNSGVSNGAFLAKQKHRKLKYLDESNSNMCANNEVSLLAYILYLGNGYYTNGIMDGGEDIKISNNKGYSFGCSDRYYYGGNDLNLSRNTGDSGVIKLNIPLSWCYSNIQEGNAFIYNQKLYSMGSNIYGRRPGISNINTVSMVNTRRNIGSNKQEIGNSNKFQRVYGWMRLKIHKNTYKYKPTNLFKFISLFFVLFRWFILVSRMIVQVWNSGFSRTLDFGIGIGVGDGTIFGSGGNSNNNNIDNANYSQLKFMSEIKSLISFCIFYIWSLSCVYLLFGLTTSKCSPFPRVILHESIQWLLWICVIVTLVCFQLVRLSIFDTNENNEQINNLLNENNSQNNQDLNATLRSRNRKILIQHILSVISCCGFGFSLSGSVLLLSTRITSPWVNSCFITIISQCLDLLLRGYLGLIFDGNLDGINGGNVKTRCYKYVFPVYLLKDEEKINCNKNGQREWVVKCSYNSYPPPLIFKHNFISIRLNQVSPTFYSVSDCFKGNTYMRNYSNEDNEQDNDYEELLNHSKHSSSVTSTSFSSPPSQINCMICYENQSNVVFSPCLHSGICDVCIDELMKWTVCKLRKSPCCHLCRCPIEIAWQLQVDNEVNVATNANNTGSFYSDKCIEVIYPKLQIDIDSNDKIR